MRRYPLLSIIAFALMILPGAGQTRQFTINWPLPQEPQTVPGASFPFPVLGWIGYFETNRDKLQNGPYDLVFDGDTLTQGWESAGSTIWQQNYGSIKAVELGIPYDTEQVQNITWRVQHGSLAEQSPKLIVVEAGGYNYDQVQTPANVAAGIQTLLNEYKTRYPRAHILLLGIFPRDFSATSPLRPWISQVNTLISAYADGQQVTYMDIGPQFLQPDGSITTDMMPDGTNLSAQGYAIWAAAIQPVVNQYVTNASTFTYALTVNNGTGGGSYAPGTAVTVKANAPANGSQFAGWTGDTGFLANPAASTTTLTTSAQAMTITATYTTTPTAPSAPTVLTATPGISKVALTWTASQGAASYNIYRGTSAGGESTTAIATGVTSTIYNDTSLPNNTSTTSVSYSNTGTTPAYYYTVVAVNNAGTSGASNESSATPLFFPSTGQTRPMTYIWPLPQPPANVPVACFPAPLYDAWMTAFEQDFDKLASGPYDMVFDGDSITLGWVGGGISVWQQYYGSLKPLDLAIGGDQVENVTWRLQNGDLAGQDPKFIVQLAGSANVGQNPPDVAAGVKMLTQQFEASCPHAHILVVGFLPRGPLPSSYDRIWAGQVNQIVSGLFTGDSRVTYLDIGPQLLQPDGSISTDIYPDYLHPSVLGYAIYANAIQTVVNQYLIGTTAAPGAPTGLKITAGNTTASLGWTCSTGATSFNVFRGTSAGGEGSTPIATGIPTTYFADSNLTNGTAYYYKVVAVNAQGTSGSSNEVTATPAAASNAPFPVTGLTATAGNAQASLSWTASSGATSYNIYRGTSIGGESGTAIAAGITSTSYTDTNLTNGTTYYYTVVAVNSSGVAAPSNEAHTTPTSGLAAPTGLTASASNGEVSLSWTASPNAKSYNVYRGTSPGGESSTPIATGITSTSYFNTGLANGEPFYYTVAAVNGSATSGYSNEANATPLLGNGTPPVPTGLIATASNEQVSLSWAASWGATSYNIYRGSSTGGENGTPLATGVTSTSYTDTGLTNGTAYYYKVSAVNSSGASGMSNEASASPNITTQITWGAAQYMVGNTDVSTAGIPFDAATFYRSPVTINGVTFNPLSISGTVNGYTGYSDGIISANSQGNSPGAYGTPYTSASPSSAAYSALTSVIAFDYYFDGSVVISGLTIGHSYQVQVWCYYTAAPGVDYTTLTGANTVTLIPESGEFAIGTFTAGSTSQTFNYKNGINYGLINAISVRDITPSGTPTAPTNLTVITGNAQASLSWAASTGATSYSIYRGTTPGGESATAIATGITLTSFTDTGLTNGTTYYYKVVAVNSSGTSPSSTEASGTSGAIAYSQWSSTYFTAQQLTDPTVSGLAAIPQKDGISNLLKYLFDINPSAAMSAADRAALPAVGMTTVSGSSYLTLTYRQNTAETGLVINVQTSTDMNTWTTVTPDNTVNVGTDPATNDPLIQVQVKVPAGTPREFIRLNVTGS